MQNKEGYYYNHIDTFTHHIHSTFASHALFEQSINHLTTEITEGGAEELGRFELMWYINLKSLLKELCKMQKMDKNMSAR